MNILGMLLESQGAPAVKQLASSFGIGEGQAKNAVSALVPALTRGLQKNLSQGGGVQDLIGALSRGNHQQYLDQPEALAGAAATAEGNGILGHLLGSKDVSRQVASHAASQTGLDVGLLKKMLPVVASMVMGGVSKQAGAQNMLGGGSSMPDLGGLLGFLDADKDESVIDDVLGMAGKLFK